MTAIYGPGTCFSFRRPPEPELQDGLQEAEDLLKGALLIDPEFTDAKIELASSYVHQLETGLMDQPTAVAEIISMSDLALAERPDDPVAKALSTYAKALALASQGDENALPDLVSELEAIVARAPAELEPRMLLVRAYKNLKRIGDTLPVIEGPLVAIAGFVAIERRVAQPMLDLELFANRLLTINLLTGLGIEAIRLAAVQPEWSEWTQMCCPWPRYASIESRWFPPWLSYTFTQGFIDTGTRVVS